MKKEINDTNWTPTLTLAKLYEEQNQFYDALAAYELISQHDSSPAIRQKIESLQSRVLGDHNLKYDPRIEQLFSPEELAYLKILTHSGFENLSRAQQHIKQGMEDYAVVFDDDEAAPGILSPSEELQQMLEEIDNKAVKKPAKSAKYSNEPTVGELAVELIRRYGKEKKLSDLSMKEFMQLFLDFHLPAKQEND